MSTRINVERMDRRKRLSHVAIAVITLPWIGGAAETCPWLNAATAGGFLGGTTTVNVMHENANRDDAACAFTSATSELRIGVETMDPPHSQYIKQAEQCGGDAMPLKAIGNEAVVCSPHPHTARVVGRVRNRIFTILINTSDPSTTADLLREKARAIAEQVAGILF